MVYYTAHYCFCLCIHGQNSVCKFNQFLRGAKTFIGGGGGQKPPPEINPAILFSQPSSWTPVRCSIHCDLESLFSNISWSPAATTQNKAARGNTCWVTCCRYSAAGNTCWVIPLQAFCSREHLLGHLLQEFHSREHLLGHPLQEFRSREYLLGHPLQAFLNREHFLGQ